MQGSYEMPLPGEQIAAFKMSGKGETVALVSAAKFGCVTMFVKTNVNGWFQNRTEICSIAHVAGLDLIITSSLAVSRLGKCCGELHKILQ
jgi:hypothetical protein